ERPDLLDAVPPRPAVPTVHRRGRPDRVGRPPKPATRPLASEQLLRLAGPPHTRPARAGRPASDEGGVLGPDARRPRRSADGPALRRADPFPARRRAGEHRRAHLAEPFLETGRLPIQLRGGIAHPNA